METPKIAPKVLSGHSSFSCAPDQYQETFNKFMQHLGPNGKIIKRIDSCGIGSVDVPGMNGSTLVTRRENVMLHHCIIYFEVPQDAVPENAIKG